MDAFIQIGVEGDFEDILSASQLNIGRMGMVFSISPRWKNRY